MILRRVILGQTSLEHSEEALVHADMLYLPTRYKNPHSAAQKKQCEWRRWIAACIVEIQADPSSTKIVRMTPELQAFLSERDLLHKQVSQELLAETEEQWLRDMGTPVSAQTRFMELHGHRERWRPGDY